MLRLEAVRAVHDGGPRGSSDTIVVGLTNSADGADVVLDQKVGGYIAQTFLRDHHVGLQLSDVGHLLLNIVLLSLQ